MVLAFSVMAKSSQTRVLALAVTHTPPRDPADAVPFPAHLKTAIGLDDRPAWIVTTEGNAFVWPGPDLRPVPGRLPRVVVYGGVPANLLQNVAQLYLANRVRQRVRLVRLHEGGQSSSGPRDRGGSNIGPLQHLNIVLHFVCELSVPSAPSPLPRRCNVVNLLATCA